VTQFWAVCGRGAPTKQQCCAQESLKSPCLIPVLQLIVVSEISAFIRKNRLG